jgi:hypothetical protein
VAPPDEPIGHPEIAGIAAAARQISASLIAASRERGDDLDDDVAMELATRPIPRLRATDLDRIAEPPTMVPADRLGLGAPDGAGGLGDGGDLDDPGDGRDDLDDPGDDRDDLEGDLGDDSDGDDDPTLPPPLAGVPRRRAVDDEKTLPRELPLRARPPSIAPPTHATGPLASALFLPVPPRNRAAVLQRFRRKMVAIGTTVIRRGETGHGLVLVVSGRLDQHAESADGARVSLGEVAAGDHVGEVSLLAHAPAPAYVVAIADSELLVLDAAEFYELVGTFPTLRAELEHVAARRARDHAARLGA